MVFVSLTKRAQEDARPSVSRGDRRSFVSLTKRGPGRRRWGSKMFPVKI